MEGDFRLTFDPEGIRGPLKTPCYVVDRDLLRENLEVLAGVKARTGCKILLALKGFAMWSTFDLVREYLDGTAASSLFEAQLGHETFGREVHLTAPAYREDEFDDFLRVCHHIIFNSFGQWRRYRERVKQAGRKVECGLRLNPEHSEVKTAIYDPCGPGSRLGIPRAAFEEDELEGISGLHFHNLCELNADSLARTLEAVRAKFGAFIPRMKWVNFGGGHHVTRADYDVNLLCDLINDFRKEYKVEVILEPGEAIALNTGYLVASVLDVVHNDVDVAVLDTSASAHMPDVLEMPYRARIYGAEPAEVKPHTYRLAGMTCLAGDVIGDYSFDHKLRAGEKLVFSDMAHYTMVKNTMFNGIRLPDIMDYSKEAGFRLIRRFDYGDFKGRLS